MMSVFAWAKSRIGSRPRADQPTPPKRILVYRLGSIGDFVIALPSLHLIRRRYPSAEIALLTNLPIDGRTRPASSIVEGTGLIDRYIAYPASTRDVQELHRIRSAILAFAPDLFVYLAAPGGAFRVYRDYLFFRLCGIRRFVGVPFARDARRLRANGTVFEREAHRLLRCLAGLGEATPDAEGGWLDLSPAELAEADHLLDARAKLFPGLRFLALSTGTKQPIKEWSDDHWQALLGALRSPEFGLILIGGDDDRERAARISRVWPGPVFNFCGLLSPRLSAAMLRHAELFLCLDSGPMHLAAAVGTRCAAVFSTNAPPGKWLPFGSRHAVFYPSSPRAAVNSIRPEEVAAVVKGLLGKGEGTALAGVAPAAPRDHAAAPRAAGSGTADGARAPERGETLLFCVRSLFCDRDGTERFNRGLAGAWSERASPSRRIVIISLEESFCLLQADGMVFIGCGGSRRRFAARLAAVIAAERPSAVFLGHVGLAPFVLLLRLLARMSVIGLLVQAGEAWSTAPNARRRRWSDYLIAGGIDRILSASTFTAEVMRWERRLDGVEFAVLPGAIEVRGGSDRAGPAPATAPLRLLTAARLGGEGRGVRRVIEALAALRPTMPALEYWVIGDGPMKPALVALAEELGLGRSVRFLGELAADAREDAYREAHIFVLPWKSDGFAFELLEAWHFRLPVICGGLDASAEIVTDGVSGIVVNPNSHDELVAALRQLILSPGERERLARNGHARLRQHYARETFVAAAERVLGELLAGSGASPAPAGLQRF